MNVAARTSQLAQSNQPSKMATTSVSMRAKVIDCEIGTVTWKTSPLLVLIYDSKRNVIAMSQVPVTPPPVTAVPDISKGETTHEAVHKNLGALILEELQTDLQIERAARCLNLRATI